MKKIETLDDAFIRIAELERENEAPGKNWHITKTER